MLHTQKLESLGILAGGIAHDFNNILMSIMGNASLSLMDIPVDSPGRIYIEQIEKASRRASELINQMLAYSGKGTFVIQKINLSEIVKEMAFMLEVSVSKKVVLKYNFSDNLPLIEADVSQIQQIVMNLIVNASDAIGDKSGVISISTNVLECDKEYIDKLNYKEGIHEGVFVSLEVTDTGCGIPSEISGKIFDPFFTTKFTGRGLGLAAVQGIIRSHKGAIKVYSEINKGTTFKVLLPVFENDIIASNFHINNKDMELITNNENILLIDDEESVRTIGKKMLEKLGFNVILSKDGIEGLDVIKSTPEKFSYIILDLTMPHMDGEECFREIMKLNKKQKIIMSSGYNEQEITQRFLGKGIAGFIQKPYTLTELKNTIKKVIT